MIANVEMMNDPNRLKRAMMRAAMGQDISGGEGDYGLDMDEGPPRLYDPSRPPINPVPPQGPLPPEILGGAGRGPIGPPPPMPTHDLPPIDPRIHQRIGELQDRTSQPYGYPRPEGIKGKILQVLTTLAPILGGRLAGGLPGAAGAAQGVATGIHQEDQLGLQNKQLDVGELTNLERMQETAREQDIRNVQAQANLEATRAWHSATTTNQAQRNLITSTNYNQQHVDRMRAHGLLPDGTPIPQEQLAPGEQAKIELTKAQEAATQAQQELREAQYEPSGTIYRQKQLMYQMAMARLRMAEQGLGLRQNAEARAQAKFETDYPQVEGGAEGERVHNIGQSKSRADAAHSIVPLIEDAKKMIADPQIAAQLGPLKGRWSDLMKRYGSLKGPVRELAGTLISIYSLAGTMHGWRALEVAQKFQETYGGLEGTPESLFGGLEAMRNTANRVYQSGYGRSYGSHPANPRANPKNPRPNTPAPGPGGGVDFEVGSDGRVRRVLKPTPTATPAAPGVR